MLERLIRTVFVIFIFLALCSEIIAQTSYYAVANGSWGAASTWSLTPTGLGGAGVPTANDDAYTNGSTVTVTAGATCKNLAVSYNVAGSLTGAALLEITGTMAGWDDIGLIPTQPTVNVFVAPTPIIRFTAANYDGTNPFLILTSGEVLGFWNSISPFGSALFALQKDAIVDGGDPLFSLSSELRFGLVQISGGTLLNPLELQTGPSLTAFRPTSLIVAANTSFISGVPISGATGAIETAMIASTSITGTLTTTSYINSTAFVLGTTGILETSFNGASQTQGWWYDTNAPTGTFTINATSTVTFNHTGNQNFLARSYGNLNLEGSGTKVLNGSGLIIQGSLSVETNTTFSPTTEVDFTTPSAAQISGDGTLSFNGGFEVNKNGSLVLSKPVLSTSGIKATLGTLDLGNSITTLSSGDFIIGTGGIVTSGTGTVIVAGNSNFSGTGSLSLHNLTTQVTTGVADIEIGAWSISGNITNSGSIILPSNSTVTFNGGSTQNISGNAFDIGNMVVNKSSSVLNNNADLTLLETLTVSNGTFDANGAGSGNFILNSDTNSDARIGPMTGGSITGEVTFQRYFLNTTVNRWRNFSFPVTSVGYTELAPLSLQANSLATYNESSLGNVDQGWSFVNGGTLNSTRGHTAWMYNAQPITLSLKGPLLQNVPATPTNRYNFGVTYTNDPGQPASQDGWNFVVNPFACPINWNSGSGWVKNGSVVAAAAVWDEENYVYRVSNVDWNGVVAAGQGFWVHTIGVSPDLRCEEAVKVSFLSNPDPTFYRQADNQVESKVLMSLKSGERVDRTMIQFRKEATEEFDAEFDFYKLKNGIFNLSTLTNEGSDLAANVLPRSKCGSSIKLKITNISPGTYSLSIDGLESFDNLQSITLIDGFTEKSQIVKENDLYSFEVTGDPDSFGSERFQLQFDFTDDTPNPVISKEGNRLVSSSLSGNQWYLNDTPIEGATGRSFVPSVHGEYHVRVQDGRCSLRSESIPVIDCLNRIFPNPASEWLKVDVYHLVEDGLSGRILIHSAQGQLVRDESFNSGDTVKDIDILDVKPGSYIVTVVSGTGVILEKSKVVIK